VDYCVTPRAERERRVAQAIARETAQVDRKIAKTVPKPSNTTHIVDIQPAAALDQAHYQKSQFNPMSNTQLDYIETESRVSQLECAQRIQSQQSSPDEIFRMRIVESQSHTVTRVPFNVGHKADANMDPNVFHILGPSKPSTPVFSYEDMVKDLEWIKSYNPVVGATFIAQLYNNIHNTKGAMEKGVQKRTGDWINDLLKN
jgi:hypothetical protein